MSEMVAIPVAVSVAAADYTNQSYLGQAPIHPQYIQRGMVDAACMHARGQTLWNSTPPVC